MNEVKKYNNLEEHKSNVNEVVQSVNIKMFGNIDIFTQIRELASLSEETANTVHLYEVNTDKGPVSFNADEFAVLKKLVGAK